uniref:Uncharacterized protein LOC111124811 n=1 Tax=Crassostrea virginica TaxID=6565 RepID=A0A8B8D836_CRAVI|nr:uncharacterized protein LOC111124811 [Crassostrea virginica]
MSEYHVLSTFIGAFSVLLSCNSELYTLPLAWQNKDYTVTTVSNGSSEASTGDFQSVSFTSSTAVWEERNGLSSWRCHYTDEHIVVFKSSVFGEEQSITYHCLMYKTINESLVYLHSIKVNGSHRVHVHEDHTPAVCELCGGTEADLYILYLKDNLTCGCIPGCGVALFENSCTHLLEIPIKCVASSLSQPKTSNTSDSSGSRHQNTLATSQKLKNPTGVLINHYGVYVAYALSLLLTVVTGAAWCNRGFRLLHKSCRKKPQRSNIINVAPI